MVILYGGKKKNYIIWDFAYYNLNVEGILEGLYVVIWRDIFLGVIYIYF